MPTHITPLPMLLNRVRLARKKIAHLQRQGLCLIDTWLEKKKATNTRQPTFYWRLRSRQTALPNGFLTMYVAKTDLAAYRKAIARGRKIIALERDIRDTQRRIEALMARAEKRGIVVRNLLGDPDASAEWYTPPAYVERVRAVLGIIHLDPASNAIAQQWIQAERYYSKEEDGLQHPWSGCVFCNPPYGTAETRLMARQFLAKAIASYQAGAVTAAILLLNRTGAAWYKALQQQVTAICEVAKRISFIDENGLPQESPRYYSDFLYLGKDPVGFEEIFGSIGVIRFINK